MNLDMLMMEIKRMRKTLIIALAAPVGYSLLIMIFYIGFADIFEEMQNMFNNASLQGLLNAFSMDSNTFSYILNYYVSYSGVYILIMGIVFASAMGVKMFSAELRSGTYEFLYANPISRVKVFISKSTVIVLYLVALNLLVFLVGFVSIELLKTKSPLIPWMSDENVEMLHDRADADPSRMAVFDRDEALFYEVMFSTMENQFEMLAADDVDDDMISEMMTVFLLDPDGIFDVMLASPETYMPMFGKGPGEEQSFEILIKVQKDQYFSTKDGFMNNDLMALSFFKMNPKPFLQNVISNETLSSFKTTFDLTDSEYDDIFVYYSLKNFVKLSLVTFAAMLSVSMFILIFIVVVPGGKMTTGLASGVAFFFYFANMISNLSEAARPIRYITPLSYINMDVMSTNYQTETWAWVVMLCMIAISYGACLFTIRKNDLIAG